MIVVAWQEGPARAPLVGLANIAVRLHTGSLHCLSNLLRKEELPGLAPHLLADLREEINRCRSLSSLNLVELRLGHSHNMGKLQDAELSSQRLQVVRQDSSNSVLG